MLLKWITKLKKDRLRIPLVAHPRFPPIVPPDRESGTCYNCSEIDAILPWPRSEYHFYSCSAFFHALLRSYELYCPFNQSGVATLPTGILYCWNKDTKVELNDLHLRSHRKIGQCERSSATSSRFVTPKRKDEKTDQT